MPIRSRLTMRSERRGAAAVEFALVAPLLLSIVIGGIEFGRGMMVLNLLSNASRNGARVGVLPGNSNQDITSAVNTMLQSAGIDSSQATTTILVNGSVADVSTAAAGDSVTVTVSVPAATVGWLPTSWFLNGLSLSQTAVLRHE